MAFDLLVRNGTVATSAGRRVADVAVEDGRIAAVGPDLGGTVREEIDATGLYVLPGVIDSHVHFREPGLEHEETWLTGTRAAVHGGVTTVLDMPNTIPPTDTVERARHKLALAAASAHCDFGILGLLGQNADSLPALVASDLVVGLKAFMGPTTGGLAAPDEHGLRRALLLARDANLRVAFHAEDAATIQRATEYQRGHGPRAHLDARGVRAEVRAIELIGELLLTTGASGHTLHVSSADGIAAVQAWRADLVDVTAEATPHHLLLDDEVYERSGGLAKVNPPIRGSAHRRRIWDAFATGDIDCAGSDHAPHLLEEKQRDSIWDVAAGFAGVETMLPLLLTEVAGGRLSLERLVEATSERPAQIWGLWPRKGAIAVESDADLTLVDLHREGIVHAGNLHGLNNHSPFEGRNTVGAPITTIVRGRIVVRDGRLLGEPGWGRPVSRA